MFDIRDIGEWRYFDNTTNLICPWYTSPFLEKLMSWDISEWRVFEYGAGDSTIWWRKKTKEVISVDTDFGWSEKTKVNFCNNEEEFISYPKKFINKEKFDCIIIDSEPVEWRDKCISVSLECLKDGGILIIDNYNQETVTLGSWPNADKLLSNNFSEVFKEPSHHDWKTAYWVK